MLSFMSHADNNRSEVTSKKTDGIEQTVSQTGANANGADQDYLAPAEHAKDVRQGTIILTVLFCISVVCLWLMIKKTTPEVSSAAVDTKEIELETAIAQLTGVQTDITSKMDSIVRKFSRFSDFEQVSVDELKKNPFMLEMFVGTSGIDTSLDRDMENRMKEEVLKNAQGLKLWTVMESQQGSSCMINEKILYTGDTIGGFKIDKIHGKTVALTANGINVVLKMSE